jgi:enoyl-[acyl-carrier protein] reductase II
VAQAREGETTLTLKELAPVRLIRNAFHAQVQEAYQRGASVEELKQLLGRGRAKRGMFEGDLNEGELEIGQVSGQIADILPAAAIVERMMQEYRDAMAAMVALPTFAP